MSLRPPSTTAAHFGVGEGIVVDPHVVDLALEWIGWFRRADRRTGKVDDSEPRLPSAVWLTNAPFVYTLSCPAVRSTTAVRCTQAFNVGEEANVAWT